MAFSASHSFANSRPKTGPSGPFLRLAECAEVLGCSVSTCYRMAHTGRLPVIHRQGGMYVPAAALAAFLAAEAEAALENLASDGPGPADEARTNKTGPAATDPARKGAIQ